MKNNTFHPGYIRSKIEDIRTALCSIQLDDYTVRSYIVHTTKADDEHIWFRVTDPFAIYNQHLHSFPVKLMYYKKKLGYYLNIEGEGVFENDLPTLLNINNYCYNENNPEEFGILIKATIKKAECSDKKEMNGNQSVLQNFGRKLFSLANSLMMW